MLAGDSAALFKQDSASWESKAVVALWASCSATGDEAREARSACGSTSLPYATGGGGGGEDVYLARGSAIAIGADPQGKF